MDELGRIERAVEVSVARGVGFGGLAILLTMAGLAGYPVLALESGAALGLLMWAVLELKALQATRRSYKKSEAWLMLDPRPALPPCRAQAIVGSALAATFRRYARRTLAGALLCWLASLALRLPSS